MKKLPEMNSLIKNVLAILTEKNIGSDAFTTALDNEGFKAESLWERKLKPSRKLVKALTKVLNVEADALCQEPKKKTAASKKTRGQNPQKPAQEEASEVGKITVDPRLLEMLLEFDKMKASQMLSILQEVSGNFALFEKGTSALAEKPESREQECLDRVAIAIRNGIFLVKSYLESIPGKTEILKELCRATLELNTNKK